MYARYVCQLSVCQVSKFEAVTCDQCQISEIHSNIHILNIRGIERGTNVDTDIDLVMTPLGSIG